MICRKIDEYNVFSFRTEFLALPTDNRIKVTIKTDRGIAVIHVETVEIGSLDMKVIVHSEPIRFGESFVTFKNYIPEITKKLYVIQTNAHKLLVDEEALNNYTIIP